MKVSSALIVCGGYRARAPDLHLTRAEFRRLTRKEADAVLYRGACGGCGAMASLTVPGRRANSRRQVRGFLRLEIEKAKPRG